MPRAKLPLFKDRFSRKFLNAAINLFINRQVEITHHYFQRVIQDQFIICYRPRKTHNWKPISALTNFGTQIETPVDPEGSCSYGEGVDGRNQVRSSRHDLNFSMALFNPVL